jgi:hypothetical protein
MYSEFKFRPDKFENTENQINSIEEFENAYNLSSINTFIQNY